MTVTIVSNNTKVVTDSVGQLTTYNDLVTVTGTGTDTILAVADFSGGAGTTLNAGDNISGNGDTALKVSIIDAGKAADTLASPQTASGVSSVSLSASTNGGVFRNEFNAASFTDLRKVDTSGSVALDLDVTNWVAASRLVATAAGDTDIHVINGSVGDAIVDVVVVNDTSDDASAQVIVGASNLRATGGEADNAELTYALSKASASSTAASTSAVKWNAVTASSADGGASSVVANVDSENTSTGDALTGKVELGKLGASVGNSDVTLHVAAEVTSGNATTGGLDLTKLVVTGADVAGGAEVTVETIATATSTGAATTGAVSVGKVAIASNTSGSDVVEVSSSAAATTGSATVGKFSLGASNVSVNASGNVAYIVSSSAVATTGKAAVGETTIGNVTVLVAAKAEADLTYSLVADTGKSVGTSSVGLTTVGNLSMDVYNSDDSQSYDFQISALGAGSNSVGNTVFGATTVGLNGKAVAGDDAVITRSVEAQGAQGTVGTVTYGASKYSVTGADASLTATNSVSGGGAVGDVKIDAISVANTAASATIVVENDIESSDGRVANVTHGDLNVSLGASSTFNDGVGQEVLSVDGDRVGNVTVANLTFSGGKNSKADADFSISSDNGDIGAVKFGNITAAVTGAAASSENFESNIVVNATTTYDTGAVSLGKVNLTTSGENADASLDVNVTGSALGTGAVSIGNVTLGSTITSGNTTANNLNLTATTTGDLSLGNLHLNSAGQGIVDTDIVASVSLNATGGLTIGNIKVNGGGLQYDGSTSIDNFGDLSVWLTATGSTVTVGNVNYSGYDGEATIDVKDFIGAAKIKAAKGDTDITDNVGQNTIVLNSGDDTITFVQDQDGGLDDALADNVKQFTSGSDVLDSDVDAGSGVILVGGDADSFTAFLAAANKSMSGIAQAQIYAAAVGSDSWVAVDVDADGSADYVYKVVGVTDLQTSDFSVS